MESPLHNAKGRCNIIILILWAFNLVLEITAIEVLSSSHGNLVDQRTFGKDVYSYIPNLYSPSPYHLAAPLNRGQPPRMTPRPVTIASGGTSESNYVARHAFKPENSPSTSRVPLPPGPKLPTQSEPIGQSTRVGSSEGPRGSSERIFKAAILDSSPSTSRVPSSLIARLQATRSPRRGIGSRIAPVIISENVSKPFPRNNGRKFTKLISSSEPGIITGQSRQPTNSRAVSFPPSRFRPQQIQHDRASTMVISSHPRSPPPHFIRPSKSQSPPVSTNKPTLYKGVVAHKKKEELGSRINSRFYGKKLSDLNQSELNLICIHDPLDQTTRYERNFLVEHQRRLKGLRSIMESISSAKLTWKEVEHLRMKLTSPIIDVQGQEKSKELLERFQRIQAVHIQSLKSSDKDLDYIIETLKGLSAKERGGRFWTKDDLKTIEILEIVSNPKHADQEEKFKLAKIVENLRNHKAYMVLRVSLGPYNTKLQESKPSKLLQKLEKHLRYNSQARNRSEYQDLDQLTELEAGEVERLGRKYDWMKAQLWKTENWELIDQAKKVLGNEQTSSMINIPFGLLKIQGIKRKDDKLKSLLELLDLEAANSLASKDLLRKIELEAESVGAAQDYTILDRMHLDQKVDILQQTLWKIHLSLEAEKPFQKLAANQALMEACLARLEDQDLALKLTQNTLDHLTQDEWDKLQFLLPGELRALVEIVSHLEPNLELPDAQRVQLENAIRIIQRASESISLGQKIPFNTTPHPAHRLLNLEAELERQRLQLEIGSTQLNPSSPEILNSAPLEKKHA